MISVYTPPIVSEAGNRGPGAVSPASFPSTPAGSVWPSPVQRIVTNEPFAAGCEGEFILLSSLVIAPWPVPLESAVKMPGADPATGAVTGLDLDPETSTCTCVELFPATP